MKNWLSDAADYLRRLRKSAKPAKVSLRMTRPISETQESLVLRRRSEYAKELLRADPFQEAIQFMNEQVVEEIAATDPLDTKRLTVLRLRLETISEFPQVLSRFVDEYETIAAIREQYQRRRDEYLEEPEDRVA